MRTTFYPFFIIGLFLSLTCAAQKQAPLGKLSPATGLIIKDEIPLNLFMKALVTELLIMYSVWHCGTENKILTMGKTASQS